MPRIPVNVGKYKILDRLGRGGMSVIYKAEHPTLGTPVVLKKLTLKGDTAHRDRFRREATLMMRLRHENVVGVYDHFKEGAGHYLVMEYVDGRPLSELLAREGALPPDEAAWIVGRMAAALAHIHSHGVVHRDVKPSNVLIRRDGTVKLADFGIAFSPGSAEDITAEGTALGTPSFMAPEQLEDARCADERSDMWSLGVCFFELITGRKFVTGPTPAAIREALPTALRSVSQRLPSNLPWKYRRLLKKTLRMRPGSRLSGGQAALRLLGASRHGNRPPLSLHRRLDALIASMEPAAEPTPPAIQTESEAALNESSSGVFQALLSSLSGHGRRGEQEGPGGQESGETTGRDLRSPLRHRPALTGLLVVAVAAAGGLILIPGSLDRLIRPGGYGMLALRLVFPSEAPEYWIAGAEARIFREDAESLSEVASPNLRAADDGLSLSSRRLSLPIGAYRIRWSLGDTVSWTSFRLPSYRERSAEGGAPLIQEEKLGTPPVFPLNLHWTASDAVTRQDIGSKSVMTWERVDIPGGDLESGGRYRVTVKSPGYRSASFAISVSPWRRGLRINAALWPEPAFVILRNQSQRSIVPRLDGSSRYLDLTTAPNPSRVGKLAPGESTRLAVLPGSHTIAPGLGRDSILDISLTAGETQTVIVGADSGGTLTTKLAD